jgi:zinc D-Ala-D-Ala carboxypeptidase
MTPEQLTDHFTYAEMCVTKTGLPNQPDMTAKQRLFDLCRLILEPIRSVFGPLYIHDGYRSEEVNTAVGGVSTSQHLAGEAADFSCQPMQNLTDVFLWVIEHLHFGQVILESKERSDGTYAHWIHVSLPRSNKQNYEAMIGTNGVYTKYIPVGGHGGSS